MVKSSRQSAEARLDAVFQALSDATRRSILRELAIEEKTVGQIALPFKISLAAVSKHLKVLARAELITREKRGSFQVVRLNPGPMRDAARWMSFYDRIWNKRLDSIQTFLDGKNYD